ncbi:competence protein CoiA family protein [Parasutterella secunda]|uniref:competence protein CoiA family protein n=1 Tax=Parasutterella secunda TaxID=626947 RepID=UPI003364F704
MLQIYGQRVVAKSGIRGAVCPKCHTELIAKCGEIRVHHWAHKNKLQCDDWIEDDNEWRTE